MKDVYPQLISDETTNMFSAGTQPEKQSMSLFNYAQRKKEDLMGFSHFLGM
jgi:hypothetical protein